MWRWERDTREGKVRTGWAVSSTGLSLFTLPTKAKHWTLASNKPGELFRRVEEAAEQYIKRWFVTEREQVAKRRSLEVQPVQQSKTLLVQGRRGGGGGAALKDVAKVAKPVRREKEPTETW